MAKNVLNKSTVAAKNTTAKLAPAKYSFNLKATTADIQKATAQLATSGSKLNKMAHETAVNALAHYVAHGDSTLLRPLADAIGVGMGNSRRAAFIQWCVSYCNTLEWSPDSKDFFTRKAKGVTRQMSDEAKIKPFWDKFDRARDEPTPWNFREELEKFVQRMQAGYIRSHADELPDDLAQKAARSKPGNISEKELRLIEALAKDAGVKVENSPLDGAKDKAAKNVNRPARKVSEPKAKAPTVSKVTSDDTARQPATH